MSINDSLIKQIKKYQQSKPPGTPARCIHYPSCSTYSIECYQKFNFFKATFLTIKRILFCTPLNRKVYDPVPLTKKEKEYDKEIYNEALKIIPYIKAHYNMYPKMQVEDFIKLIYQATFGPSHLGIDIESTKYYIEEEIKLGLENNDSIDISDLYKREPINKNTNSTLLTNQLIDTINSINITDDDYNIFYKRLYILQKLINKKIIKLDKKSSLKYIRTYMSEGAKPINHSSIFKETYNPHYRVIKK